MRQPGDRLRRIAARYFSARTMERLIDPAVADLQTECAAAVRARRRWTGRWLCLVGYVALIKVMAMHGCHSMLAIGEWPREDRRTLGRVLLAATVAGVIVTVALAGPPIEGVVHYPGSRVLLATLLVPQALPLALPLGLTLGLSYALAGQAVPPRLIALLLVVGVGVSLGSLALLDRVVPVANQAFRVESYRQLVPRGGTPSRGIREMTMWELRHVVQDGSTAARTSAVHYMQYWAIAASPLSLMVLALSWLTRRVRRGRTRAVMGGLAAAFGYYALMTISQAIAKREPTLVSVVAWLPVVGCALFAGLGFWRRPRAGCAV